MAVLVLTCVSACGAEDKEEQSTTKPVSSTTTVADITTLTDEANNTEVTSTTTQITTETPTTTTQATTTTTKATTTTTTKANKTEQNVDRRKLVVDAYSYKGEWSECRIPKITLSGSNVDKINKEIWNKLYPMADDARQGWSSTVYQWAVNGDILSLYTKHTFYEGGGVTDFLVYNISISTGETIKNSEIIAAAGFSKKEYNEAAKKSLFANHISYYNVEDMLGDMYEDLDSAMKEYHLYTDLTISQENIDEAMPFLDNRGELCVVANLYSPGSPLYYSVVCNLEDYDFDPSWEKYL